MDRSSGEAHARRFSRKLHLLNFFSCARCRERKELKSSCWIFPAACHLCRSFLLNSLVVRANSEAEKKDSAVKQRWKFSATRWRLWLCWPHEPGGAQDQKLRLMLILMLMLLLGFRMSPSVFDGCKSAGRMSFAPRDAGLEWPLQRVRGSIGRRKD